LEGVPIGGGAKQEGSRKGKLKNKGMALGKRQNWVMKGTIGLRYKETDSFKRNIKGGKVGGPPVRGETEKGDISQELGGGSTCPSIAGVGRRGENNKNG